MGDVDPVSGHIEKLQRALTDARGRAVSADGTLRLEAGANGTIHSIELGNGGADLDATVVVSLIVELHREAVHEAATTMRAAVAALSNDPRLHEDRQEVVDKLARPRTDPESVATPQHPSPRTDSTEPGHALPTILPTPRRRAAAPPTLSEFDPVTFVPLPRASRLAPPNQRSVPPDPVRTASDTTAAEPITGDSRDSGESVRGNVDPAGRPQGAEPTPAETDFVPADPFASWGEPGDGTGIAPGSWLPDDNLILSDDWGDWPR
ncbi:YbaB/EbfC family nucleoid-associated protein [Nocardia salmonicida]|uniref:YbaB/EbfC family nucleoid-associated protein n=1 Tax=Nocardia salmonicida TaxID=53431 RepID=UPI003647B12F